MSTASYNTTLALTILLAIGLGFFLRAASKDRTTIVDIASELPPVEVLTGISDWLEARGWRREGGDIDRQVLRFNGKVSYSPWLAVFLSLLCALGGACLGLVFCQLFPVIAWWPLSLLLLGPLAGLFYRYRAFRTECVELQLLSVTEESSSVLRLRAHRDELIAMELELGKKLVLKSDGSLLASPI
ncbi:MULTISPECIES: cofactor assembly of complex C subunit B [Prochlorococcus]|uniref:cofactor assembly of complex C subunit B n=1 Tax=Prochlorococcus TaxID=1218 RepID=UPI0005623A4A|nr:MULTISPECIES: cofactor assembly of complex C subunit B [Prochlorococcus]